MTWLLWQQERRPVQWTAVAVAVAAVFLVVTGVHFQHLYDSALQSCTAGHQGCGNLANTLFLGDNRLFDIVVATGFLLPFALTIFCGVPLLAQDFEQGTHRLAWTQSVPRLRWAGLRLGWMLAGCAALMAVVTALITWWYGPINAVQANRMGPGIFDSIGLVPVAYAVFGVALGIAVGAVVRRVLPALGITIVTLGVIRYVFTDYVRARLMPAATLIGHLHGVGSKSLNGAWILSDNMENRAGRIINQYGGIVPMHLPAVCKPGPARPLRAACLADHGFHEVITYQPASRFWAMQGIEAAIFVGAAALLVGVTLWTVRTRDA
jgi:hypothetical protein